MLRYGKIFKNSLTGRQIPMLKSCLGGTRTERNLNNIKKCWGAAAVTFLLELIKEPYSLNERVPFARPKESDDNELTWEDILINNDPNPDTIFEETFIRETLNKVLGELPLYQREVLRLRYCERLTLDDVANKFWCRIGLKRPVCKERIRQMEGKALAQAKRILLNKGVGSVSELLPAA